MKKITLIVILMLVMKYGNGQSLYVEPILTPANYVAYSSQETDVMSENYKLTPQQYQAIARANLDYCHTVIIAGSYGNDSPVKLIKNLELRETFRPRYKALLTKKQYQLYCTDMNRLTLMIHHRIVQYKKNKVN
ncbi:MAG: hypothetical protein V4553_17590 [Bacteroidota bacterium]